MDFNRRDFLKSISLSAAGAAALPLAAREGLGPMVKGSELDSVKWTGVVMIFSPTETESPNPDLVVQLQPMQGSISRALRSSVLGWMEPIYPSLIPAKGVLSSSYQ